MITMSMRLRNLIPRKASKDDNNDHGSIHVSEKGTSVGGESLTASVPQDSLYSGQVATPSNIMPLPRDSIISAFDPMATENWCISSRSNTTVYSLYFEALPSFRDVPSSERQHLLMKKLGLCCYIFEFSDTTKNAREKEIKRQTLLELVDYVTSTTGKFSESVIESVTKMVTVNLFRPFPPTRHHILDTFDAEEEEPLMDPAWSHLQIIYEIFLRFVVSLETDAKIAKRYIDHSFVLKLLDLFGSEDPRERDYLKTILHRLYGKFMVHRPFIRKAINNVFYHFIFETEKHNGIAELLEILGSIINGFALPLKEEHKLFLVRALLPLHKPKSASVYHHQLSYCITQFIEKDSKLADVVVRGLLKFWPITNSQKEVLFLGELEEVLESTQAAEFQRCMVPLFRQIARCLNSPQFQVAERALFLWNNDHVVTLIAQNRHVILPIIFNSLEMNTKGHWNPSVHGMTQNVRKMFLGLDPELFLECHRKFELDEEKSKSMEEKQGNMWKRLEVMAASRPFNSAPLILDPGLNKTIVSGYSQVAVAGG